MAQGEGRCASSSPATERRWQAVSAERDRLLRLARARLGDEQDAEDCVQEAMLRCVEFEALDEARLPQFLTSVTVRLCADHYRGRQRTDRLSRRLAGAVGPEPSHEDDICDRAEAAWLASQLDGLPARQLEMVVARADGMSCRTVAERLQVPYTTVESALARVRRSLRLALQSTLGIGLFRRWRVAGAGVTAVTVTAVALVVPFRSHEQPGPHAARPPGPVAERRVPELPGPPRDAAGNPPPAASPGGSAPVAPAGSGAAGGPGAGDTAGVGVAEDGPGVSIGGNPGPRYGLDERAGHCLRHGVYVAPRTDCGYPEGDPRNDQFPADSIVIRTDDTV